MFVRASDTYFETSLRADFTLADDILPLKRSMERGKCKFTFAYILPFPCFCAKVNSARRLL